jgi:hypothetical protein
MDRSICGIALLDDKPNAAAMRLLHRAVNPASVGGLFHPADFFDLSPEWPDTREFLSVFARSFQKRFYFALFAVGYDTGGKGSRADFRVRLPCHKLGPMTTKTHSGHYRRL